MQKRQKSPSPKFSDLNPEQRDLRTIFCMQLSTRLQKGDLLDFFTKVGRVRDVHLIRDSKSHRSKGIAYIEFYEIESASRALEMSGSKLDGIPIIVQPSHGERNRSNMTITTATGKPGYMGPMKLYVGSLHYNITEDMLRGIFEPFGPLDELKIMRDHQTGRSAGFGFLQFRHGEDGKRALEQLNGYELAGRPIKLGSVADYQINQNSSLFDIDESDKVGFGMSATGRIQLMAKLAEGTGFQIPAAAANVLQSVPAGLAGQLQQAASAPPISTQCFILSNMFSHDEHMDDNWERELKDEVIEECAKHGGVLHVHVDRHSREGNVYVKCATIASAMTSVATLHGRFFAGKQITASYVPLPNYHGLFPDAVKATQLLSPSTVSRSAVPYSY